MHLALDVAFLPHTNSFMHMELHLAISTEILPLTSVWAGSEYRLPSQQYFGRSKIA